MVPVDLGALKFWRWSETWWKNVVGGGCGVNRWKWMNERPGQKIVFPKSPIYCAWPSGFSPPHRELKKTEEAACLYVGMRVGGLRVLENRIESLWLFVLSLVKYTRGRGGRKAEDKVHIGSCISEMGSWDDETTILFSWCLCVCWLKALLCNCSWWLG